MVVTNNSNQKRDPLRNVRYGSLFSQLLSLFNRNDFSPYKEQLNHEWTRLHCATPRHALMDTNREGVTENPTLTLRV